ncbi:MAG: nicotinate phosphoribosyltransferase [Bacilli bacterium]|nr:nicotinate phosphoribosyltransferase [Bacilli bacterium]
MKFPQIVTSLLDTDLYKFNMNQVIFHKHNNLMGTYVFKCRNKGVVFTQEMVDEISEQVDALCKLKFHREELEYLRSIRFLKPDFIEFLRLWRPMRDYVDLSLNPNGELHLYVNGPLFAAMQFEIYLLEIVNEVYFRTKYNYDELLKEARVRLEDKIEKFNNGTYTFRFAEFGCRRRLSLEWEEEMILTLMKKAKNRNLVGTSNVLLAYRHKLRPVGTYAHEFVQMYQGIPTLPLAYTNAAALRDWYDEYKGDNGTALTDTLTTDLFLLDFDRSMCNNFTGVRHDSGDPFVWGEKILEHYKSYGINPKTKTLLFSDSLNCDRAQAVYDYFSPKTNVAFGIGTYFSNDTGVEPLNIVIKLQYVNGVPVAKLSDVPGKMMCQDPDYADYLHRAVEFRLKNH